MVLAIRCYNRCTSLDLGLIQDRELQPRARRVGGLREVAVRQRGHGRDGKLRSPPPPRWSPATLCTSPPHRRCSAEAEGGLLHGWLDHNEPESAILTSFRKPAAPALPPPKTDEIRPLVSGINPALCQLLPTRKVGSCSTTRRFQPYSKRGSLGLTVAVDHQI